MEPLRSRYDAQHYRLAKFYFECSNLRYLTSLTKVPKLPPEPPNFLADDEEPPSLPQRPVREQEPDPTPTPPRAPSTVAAADPDPINEFWRTGQDQQRQFEDEQRQLQEQWEAQQYQQQLAQQQEERDLQQQLQLQAEQQRLAQEQLLRDQMQAQTQGRMAELERENLAARAQYERDQLLLEQYDKVRALLVRR